MAEAAADSLTFSISAVERDTGITKDTLRVWERRYGYPAPLRDNLGERAYSVEQLDKLRLIRRLLDQGQRPGRIVRLSIEQLAELNGQLSANESRSEVQDQENEQPIEELLTILRRRDVFEFRRRLSQLLMRIGVERFIYEVVAPMNRAIGDRWSEGSLKVYEEHFYTESLQVILRSAIASIPQADEGPCVLLSTFPNEPHGLGLLMAEALLTINGCTCLSMGTETPISEIALAANLHPFDVVGLSFTACLNPNQVTDGLFELRAAVNQPIEIWAGGFCPALHRKPPEDIVVLPLLSEIGQVVARWRADH
jgi:DNA-binding transcriptional MerR regulator